MPVPTAISALSQTAASNSPATTESPTSADDYLRQYSAFIAMLRDGIGFTDPVQLASGATTSIGAQNSLFVEITGTTTITSFGTSYEGPRFLRFTGALTLTHNSTTLNLPGAANITTAAGDTAIAVPNQAANGWNVVQYQRADGSLPVALPVSGGGTGGATAVAARANLEVEPGIIPVAASVAANALTVTINPCLLNFRSTTATTGTSSAVSIPAAISMTVSSGSTLGTINATAARLVILAINNAGTAEVAIVNLAGGVSLDETGVISTTAEGGAGAADSANVIYSATARASVAYRVVGFVDITQATAGTWATAPTTVQGCGGQALVAFSTFGFGQRWQDVTGSRSTGTTYYNTTGKPIQVHVVYATGGSGSTATITVSQNGTSVGIEGTGQATTGGAAASVQAVVPPGASYVLSVTGAPSLSSWRELR